MNWGWINRLTFFTCSNSWPNICFGNRWANPPGEIRVTSNTWMSTILIIWLLVIPLLLAAQVRGTGSFADFIHSSHLCSTQVMGSANFWIDRIRAMSMDSPYSSTSDIIISNCQQSNISLVAFMRTLVFPVSVSTSQRYTLIESVFKCMTLHFHCNTRLMPFSAASSSAKLMCWASFVGCSQHTSSKTTSLRSRSMPVARELVSTHTLMSCPVAHHRLCVTLAIVFQTICHSGASSVVSSHPRVTALGLRFIIPVATHTLADARSVSCTEKK